MKSITPADSRQRATATSGAVSKHIGIVGCSAEGAALCYRTICTEAEGSMGEHRHPEVSMHTFPLADYMQCIYAGDWDGVAALMHRSACKLAAIGAELAICPDNTIHQAFEAATRESPIPWLHIAEVVAATARSHGVRKLGITGTDYLMTGPVYPGALEKFGIDYAIPGDAEREEINRIIFDELVKGEFTNDARRYFNDVFDTLASRGCDAVVMGCTEIPILMDGVDSNVPLFDSTRLLARAAITASVDGSGVD